MILLIDNYDSFSFNLYQYIGSINPDVKVIRNDQLTVEQIAQLKPERIILSPGPGRPEDAGVTVDVIKSLSKTVPTLGVCLGHQAICQAFRATVTYAKKLMHGKQSQVMIDNSSPLFVGCKEKIKVARYHSLAADTNTIPECLRVIGATNDNEIMAVEHKQYPIYGVQFHPESILTPDGMLILRNFLDIKAPAK